MTSLRHRADRDAYASAHALLRVEVAAWAGVSPTEIDVTARCATCGGPHGPAEVRGPFPGPPPFVSMSRTNSWVLTAVGDVGPIGVDVEAVALAAFEGFASVALHPEEAASDPADRAVMWVRKEAALKATRYGLTVDPRTIRVSAADQAPEVIDWGELAPAEEPVELVDLSPDADHAGCVAWVGPKVAEPPTLREVELARFARTATG